MSNGRKVSTDALETLGTIIGEGEKRDAIHLAVLPVVAGQRLHSGQDIAVVDGVATTGAGKPVGIVDPFLKVPVQAGERFWLVLYPRMVTSLRHVWSHPAFADEGSGSSARAAADLVIDRCADEAGLTRDEMIEGARDYLRRGEYLSQGGRWEGHVLSDDFWPAYEVVTGETVPTDDRGSFFSCSC